MADGVCRCPDECIVEPAGSCEHGLASWWLVLRTLHGDMDPSRLVPLPTRLDPGRPDYVAIIDAHHAAVVAGAAGYTDPGTGLFVQTATTLWGRGACCEQGCRHCPYSGRTC
jgi:hypothetical protein